MAAIDIGTVTARLLIAEVRDGHVTELSRRLAITHVGEGLTATGRLSEAAMGRTAEAVAAFAAEAAEAGAKVAAVATSASRDAANGDRFMEMLAEAGARPEIITGDREAGLSFLGATYGLAGDGFLVADLGGGSTELVLGAAGPDGRRIHAARSVDVGSKRVTEMFLHADPPTPAQLTEAREWILGEMRSYFDALPSAPRELHALAGTATSLVAIDLAMADYDPERVHGARISAARLAEIRASLASLPLAEREQVTGLEPARAGVIVAGALVLEAILELAGLNETVVSEHDLLYGIALDAAGC